MESIEKDAAINAMSRSFCKKIKKEAAPIEACTQHNESDVFLYVDIGNALTGAVRHVKFSDNEAFMLENNKIRVLYCDPQFENKLTKLVIIELMDHLKWYHKTIKERFNKVSSLKRKSNKTIKNLGFRLNKLRMRGK